MVSNLYKWSMVLLLLPVMAFTDITRHPYHVSTTEIEHDIQDKSLQVTCRMFTDDFESILSRTYQIKADFADPALKQSMDSVVKKYVLARMSIQSDNKSVSLTYLGWEKDGESVYAFFEAVQAAKPSSIQLTNTLLYDLFDDQAGIIHATVSGKRQTKKLVYPTKSISFSF